MPAPGDQHKAYQNPFEDPTPRISIWTAQEIATIASKLDKQLGPEYISARAGPGGQRVHYLTAEKCITLANEVFGFNGWSSSIQNIQVDFADENPQSGRVSIGLSVIVRVTLRDGTYHEDIGYGSIENAKGKAMAFEKAKKEGTTDGLKRALRSFGNVLGNCIYDKDYVQQVVKHKAQPVKKFDPNNLHRHADFVAKDRVKEEPAPRAAVMAAAPPKPKPAESFEDFLGELDEVDFCVPEDGHPDEIVLPGLPNGPEPQAKGPVKASNQPSTNSTAGPNSRAPQTPNQIQPRPAGQHIGANPPQQSRPQPALNTRPLPNQQPPGPTGAEPVAFFSAKAVNQLPESSFQGQGNGQITAPQAQQLFNPRLESPSIRKTPGIDHTSSKPLTKSGQHVAPSNSQAQASNSGSFTPVRPSMGGQPPRSSNVINPTLDHTRRIGAPTAPGSPLSNRGSFRQPTMKRPPPGDGNGANGSRPALVDIPPNTNGNPNTTAADGLEAKRQRTA